jgi:two-component system sensor histidine kinase SenX3
VTVWSEEGLGSTFTLRIPLADVAPTPAGDAPAEHDLAGGPSAGNATEGRS